VTINVQKGTPTATLVVANSPQAYNGSPKAAMVIVSNSSVPGAVSNIVTGGGATQTMPGTYAVTANFVPNDTANYNTVVGVSAGNFVIGYGTCSASYGQGGVILPPINSNGTSVFNRKGGSTIPVKFTVCDASGNPISNPAAVFSGTGGQLTMLSAVRGTITVVNESGYTDVPDAAFRWSSNQWIFNMATSNLTAGSTYTFHINLAVGYIEFVVGVK
jgi:hypothetical protein